MTSHTHLSTMPHTPAPGRAVSRVLSIAGTDPSGGAGAAADMKSITAAGGYGMTVVTSLVAQNTTGARAILTWVTGLLHEAIAHGHELHVGHGHGPVDHGYRARRLAAMSSGVTMAPGSRAVMLAGGAGL